MQKRTAAALAGLFGLILSGPALSGDNRVDPGRDAGTTSPQIDRPAGTSDSNPMPELDRNTADGFDWSGAPKIDYEILAMSCSPAGLQLADGTPLFSIVNTSPSPIPKGASLRIEWPVDQVKWFYNPYELLPGDSFNITAPDGVTFSVPFHCEARATVV